jgi:hypothetical protein
MKKIRCCFLPLALLAMIQVAGNAQVVVTPMPPSTICIGTCVTLSATASGGIPAYTYSWSLSGTPVVSPVCPVVTSTYTVIAADSHGSVSPPATMAISVNPALEVVTSLGPHICPGTAANLTAIGSGGDGVYSYQWYPATGLSNANLPNPLASPSVTTTYTVIVADNCGTPADSAFTTVTLHPAPIVALAAADTAVCVPGCVTFYGVSVPACVSAIWIFGDGGVAYGCDTARTCYLISGLYTPTLSITDVNGCTGSISHPAMIFVSPCTGVQNYTAATVEMNLSPNPFQTTIHLGFEKVSAERTISIYDLMGRKVYNEVLDTNETYIDLNTLSKGIYLLKVDSGNEVQSKKIVKL